MTPQGCRSTLLGPPSRGPFPAGGSWPAWAPTRDVEDQGTVVGLVLLEQVDQQGAQLRLLQRTGDPGSAVGEFELLARTEPAFAQERHELYYDLARAHDQLQHFDKAVRAARAYVEAYRFAEKNGAPAIRVRQDRVTEKSPTQTKSSSHESSLST